MPCFGLMYLCKIRCCFSDSLEVRLSTDCGSNWTTIYLKGGSLLQRRQIIHHFLYQTHPSGVPIGERYCTGSRAGNVMRSFVNRGHYGQPIYLDNINLFTSALGINIGKHAHQLHFCTGQFLVIRHPEVLPISGPYRGKSVLHQRWHQLLPMRARHLLVVCLFSLAIQPLRQYPASQFWGAISFISCQFFGLYWQRGTIRYRGQHLFLTMLPVMAILR